MSPDAIKVILQTLFNFCKENKFKHEHMIIAEELLTDTIEELTIHNIKLIVYKHFNMTEQQVDVPSRKGELVKARQIAMAIAYTLSDEYKMHWSLNDIAYEIGKRDHATVLHAKKTVRNQRDTNRKYDEMYRTIEERIRIRLKPIKEL